MTKTVLFLLTGLFTGIFSGIIGIGGGIIIVPVLILLFGFSQHQAQGTTLALLVPPIGILAAYTYYKSGYVNIQAATFICLGFFIGGLLGSKIAVNLPEQLLQKIFGGILLMIGFYMITRK